MEPINAMLSNMSGPQLILFLALCVLTVLGLQIAMWRSFSRATKRLASQLAAEHAQQQNLLLEILEPPLHAPPKSDPHPPSEADSGGLH